MTGRTYLDEETAGVTAATAETAPVWSWGNEENPAYHRVLWRPDCHFPVVVPGNRQCRINDPSISAYAYRGLYNFNYNGIRCTDETPHSIYRALAALTSIREGHSRIWRWNFSGIGSLYSKSLRQVTIINLSIKIALNNVPDKRRVVESKLLSLSFVCN